MARANPHWKTTDRMVLAIFSGPHVYVSPSWYEAENVVMRTTLRPEPMPELFARFLAAHAEENGCPAATE